MDTISDSSCNYNSECHYQICGSSLQEVDNKQAVNMKDI